MKMELKRNSFMRVVFFILVITMIVTTIRTSAAFAASNNDDDGSFIYGKNIPPINSALLQFILAQSAEHYIIMMKRGKPHIRENTIKCIEKIFQPVSEIFYIISMYMIGLVIKNKTDHGFK